MLVLWFVICFLLVPVPVLRNVFVHVCVPVIVPFLVFIHLFFGCSSVVFVFKSLIFYFCYWCLNWDNLRATGAVIWVFELVSCFKTYGKFGLWWSTFYVCLFPCQTGWIDKIGFVQTFCARSLLFKRYNIVFSFPPFNPQVCFLDDTQIHQQLSNCWLVNTRRNLLPYPSFFETIWQCMFLQTNIPTISQSRPKQSAADVICTFAIYCCDATVNVAAPMKGGNALRRVV